MREIIENSEEKTTDAPGQDPIWIQVLSSSRVIWIVLACLLVLVWGPRLFRSFWVDEAGTFWMAHEGLWTAMQKTSHWPGQSILYSAIASLFCLDAGPFREFILRIPTLIAMAVAGYFICKLAEHGIGKRSGLVAVILFAFHPAIVEIGTQARPYGFALAAVAGSCWMLYRWVETQERQYLIGYAVASTLIFYFHYLFAVLFCAHAAYLAVVILFESRVLRWRELMIAYAAIGALVLPLLPHIRLLLREAHTLPFSEPPSAVNLTDWLLPSMVAFGLVLGALLIQLLVGGSFTGGFNGKRPLILQRSVLVLLLTWWLIGPVLLFLVSKATPMRMFVLRYLAYSVLAQVLLLAYGGYAQFGPRMAGAWALIAVLLSTASPVTILTGSKPGPEALMPIMRIIQAESIGTSPSVFFRSELPESDFYNWRGGLQKNSYLYAPFVAYPMKNRLLPLPYHLTAEVKAHISGVIDSKLFKESAVLFVTRDDTWAPWMIERMRQAGFEATVHTPNSFTVSFSNGLHHTLCEPTDMAEHRETISQCTPDRGLIMAFWASALLLGIIAVLFNRTYMNPDGVSYLDLGDAMIRGDWGAAISGYWSPLYPALLGAGLSLMQPPLRYEFTAVHALTFLCYVFTLASFHFFLTGMLGLKTIQTIGYRPLPSWAFLSISYTLFIWAMLEMIGPQLVTPDMCVAGFVFLATGLLLRLRAGAPSVSLFVRLGLVLGLAYLTKAVMFPLAFLFFAAALVIARDRKVIVPAIAGCIAFVIVSAPFVAMLSHSKGRLTFGDTGRLNYSFLVNVTPNVHWQGEPIGSGTPVHATRKIFGHPAVYEFAQPVFGTYAAWSDPSYWNEGLKMRFNLKQQLHRLNRSMMHYVSLLFVSQAAPLVGLLVLYSLSLQACMITLNAFRPILFAAGIPLVIYAFLSTETRFTAAFIVVLWITLLATVRLPDSTQTIQFASRLAFAVVFTVLAQVALLTYANVRHGVRDDTDARIADTLHGLGFAPGTKVGYIGHSFQAYWARLGRFRITAEIPGSTFDSLTYTPSPTDAEVFWSSSSSTQDAALRSMLRSGVRCILTKNPPNGADLTRWGEIGNTGAYVHPKIRANPR